MYSSHKYDPYFYGTMKKIQKADVVSDSSEALNELNEMYFSDYEFYQETGIKNTSQAFRDNYKYFENAIIDNWLLKRLGNSNNFKINSDLSFQPVSRSSWFETILLVILAVFFIGAVNLFILGESSLSDTFIISSEISALLILMVKQGSFIFDHFVRHMITKQIALGDQKRQQIRDALQEKFLQSVKKNMRRHGAGSV